MEIHYRISEASKLLGIPKPTIYYLIKKDSFPTGIRISDKLRVWSESELQDWLDSRKGNGCMRTISRGALLERLRRDCAKRNERVKVLRTQNEINEFGEIVIIGSNNGVVAHGDLKDLADDLLSEMEVLA